MKRIPLKGFKVVFISLLLFVMPAWVHAQTEQIQSGPPPVGQQIVREGDFAIKLESTLGVGTGEDEAEAETRLAEVGVVPRNGWIADYPVTPDIIGELYKSVSDAVDSQKLALGKDDALKRLNDVTVALGVGVRPAASGKPEGGKAAGAENYPNPTIINNYYNSEGPPVVTYYAPPPDYYYLYAWVPFPFWGYGFWFPGFFILNDFHRTIFVNQRVRFVSNHFNDIRNHRVFRIDPVSRFSGRTFAGIGVTRTRAFIPTGVPRSERQIFNAPRTRMPVGSRMISPPTRGRGTVGSPSRGTGTTTAPARGGSVVSPRPGGGDGVMERGQRR